MILVVLVDRLGRTSEYYIEIEQKGGAATCPPPPPREKTKIEMNIKCDLTVIFTSKIEICFNK